MEKEPIKTDGDGAPEEHSNLLDFVAKADERVQALFGEGDKTTTVEMREVEHTFSIYAIAGAEARIRTDIFESMPERMAKMQDEEDEETGKKKYTKDDIEKFMMQWCVNRCRAVKGEKCTRDNFWELVKFVKEIVFEENLKARDTPPKGITLTKAVKRYKQWDSHKFMVKVSLDTMIRLEAKVRKMRKKGDKKEIYKIEAMSAPVIFLQRHMVLKPGQYVTAAGFAAYFKDMHKAMFPVGFGTDEKKAE